MRCKLALLLAALLAVLSGCSLAQPEAGDSSGGRFAGFFVVYDTDRKNCGRGRIYSSPNLITQGEKMLDTDFGKVGVPRNIVVGEEKDGKYSFGIEGRSLFLIHGSDPVPFCDTVSDMADSQLRQEAEFNEGKGDTVTYRISGTVYIGPPADAGPDWQWYNDGGGMTFFRVYEASDGTVYLDDSGNSSNGLGAYSENRTFSKITNGKMTSETIEVTVNAEYAPRLEKLTVSQFDGSNTLLQSDDLALRENLPEVECLPETAWVLVEEQSADGTARTAYNASDVTEEEPEARHTVVLLDKDGLGTAAELCIRFPDRRA